MGKNITKNLSKYSQKHLDHAKKLSIDELYSFSKRVIQKAPEATGDLIGNKIVDRITKVSKILQQNNSETVTNDNYKEIPKKRSPEDRQEIIDELRLK